MTSRLDPPRHRLYVLRCLANDNQDGPALSRWQFCLKEVQTGKEHNFADLDALMQFLHTETVDDDADAASEVE